MTADHPVRRLLARLCSPDTMTRVVDPTLADMRVERHRPALLGYLSLARALTAHACTSLPGALARFYTDDGRAMPRLVAIAVVTAFIAALPLVLMPMLGPLRNGLLADGTGRIMPSAARTLRMLLLLLPQGLAITLPPAMLAAVPLALRGRHVAAPLRRVIVIAAIACVAMGVLINWGVPLGNQRFRVVVSGNPQLPRGPSEAGLAEMRQRMVSLRHNTTLPPERVEQLMRGEVYRYQMRLALIASPLPLALLGAALTSTRIARKRPVLTGLLAMAIYVLALDSIATSAVRVTSLSPILIAWLPISVLFVAAAVMTRPRSRATSA